MRFSKLLILVTCSFFLLLNLATAADLVMEEEKGFDIDLSWDSIVENLEDTALLKYGAKEAIRFAFLSRCDWYRPKMSDYWEWKNCRQGMDIMVKKMDLVVPTVPGENLVALIFYKEMIQLIQQKEVQSYLKELRRRLEDLQSESSYDGLSLYEFTLAKTKNHKKALQWIAVLFQDTDALCHWEYITEHLPKLVSEEVYDNWLNVLDLLSSDYADDHWRKYYVRIYPEALKKHYQSFTNSLYHFYVTAYLAADLKEKMPYAPSQQFVATTLTTAYKYNYIMGKKSFVLPPIPADRDKNEYRFQDMFMAQKASIWARSDSINRDRLGGFIPFSYEMAKDPVAVLRKFF